MGLYGDIVGNEIYMGVIAELMTGLWKAIPKYPLILFVGSIVIVSVLKHLSPKIKGWIGEYFVKRALAKLPQEYKQWHDVYLLDSEGHTTQIDHLIASARGIFVIETKNYKGWIHGSDKQKTWTQSIYGKKFNFQNPLHQNDRHIRVLAEATGLKKSDFYNVIMFIGAATLKTDLPTNVMTRGLLSFITNAKPFMMTRSQITAFCSHLEKLNLRNEKGIAKRHLKSLKDRRTA